MKTLAQATSIVFVGVVCLTGGVKAVLAMLVVGVVFHLWHKIKFGFWLD